MTEEARNELTEMPGTTDPELRRLLGLFDTPAFTRRGQELDETLERLHARCRRERERLGEMVAVRLRQWARLATGPRDGMDLFWESPEALGNALGQPPLPWAVVAGSTRRRRGAARDLSASVVRFNRRWTQFLLDFDLRSVNQTIDQYNRYYLIEKECALGSARLAALHFRTIPAVSADSLAIAYPPLPDPLKHEEYGTPPREP